MSTALFALACVFQAADAGRLGEDDSGLLWIAPELVETQDVRQPDYCAARPHSQRAELRFEKIDAGTNHSAALPLAAGGNRLVSFEWNANRGELSFDIHATAALALPESMVTAVSAQLPAGQRQLRDEAAVARHCADGG